ncbi:hypothetical protein CEXT_660391 [Caerostris extrusa]|uniref:Uncharacterized protein n=1 Tax=Caerostris extrusa TaxID=172846 RepID=A0AAV4UGZ9_CAEEX|nr:hypothetical protein CEXT_660391 [Caerostris extrusa]
MLPSYLLHANEEGTSTIHCNPLIPRPGLSSRHSSLHFESLHLLSSPQITPHQKYHQQKVLRPPTRKNILSRPTKPKKGFPKQKDF